MLELMKIILFSKMVLLTPNPIDIDASLGEFSLKLNEPISAITSGASLFLDVTNMLLEVEKKEILCVRKTVRKIFRPNSIEALLIGKEKKIRVFYQGAMLIKKDSVWLGLTSNEIPKGLEFNEIKIKTKVNLKNILIYWKNFKN